MKRMCGYFLFVILYLASASALADETKFSKEQICKACVSIVMGKDPSIIKIDKTEGDVVYLSYIRSNDGTKWAYRCKLSGNRAIWANAIGRWRDSQWDSNIIYKIDGDTLQIEDRFNDGSATKESYSYNQLK